MADPTPAGTGQTAPAPAPNPVATKIVQTLTSRKFLLALGTTLSLLATQIGTGAHWNLDAVLKIALPLLGWAVVEGLADAVERAVPALAFLIEPLKALISSNSGQPAPVPALPEDPAPVKLHPEQMDDLAKRAAALVAADNKGP